MNKHTPGPWLVTGGTFVYALNGYGTNSFWANIYGGSQGGYKSPATPSEEIEANANLIAAAPDFLQALIEISNTTLDYDNGTGHSMIEIARKAIARYQGDQS